VLGLPDGITTRLFDLDGVLTQTAKVHAKAWKQMFDEFLRSFGWVVRVDRTGHAEALREHGADIVVEDLAEMLEHGP
jgi:beta-phosphoglucomutase-like phosphatase (HAD superfamily)